MLASIHRNVRATFGGLPRTFWLIWAGSLITRLGGFVLPFLAIYLTHDRGLSLRAAGLVVSLYGAGSFLASLLGGLLADHVGRRATLLLSLFCAAGTMFALGFGRSLGVVAPGTFLLGFFSDLQRPAVAATLSDVVEPGQRLRAFGLLYWAFNIGFAVAPVVGGLLANRRFELLFLGDGTTTLIYGLIVLAAVPETRPLQRPQRPATKPQASGALRDPVLLAFCGIMFLFATVFMQSFSTLALDMRAKGISPGTYGLVMATNGILIVFAQPIATRWVERFSRAGVLAVAALLVGAGFGLGSVCSTALGFTVSVVIWTLGEVAQTPVTSAVVADLAPAEARGRYQGVYYAAVSLAFAVAPSLGAWTLEALGSRRLWLGCFLVCVLVAGAHLAIAPARSARLAAIGEETVVEPRLYSTEATSPADCRQS